MSKMTMNEFRISHSTLIDHYQHIEFYLKEIYAVVHGHEFCNGLEEVARHNLRRLLNEIKQLDIQNELSLFSASDYERLFAICERRNFWCHSCYVDMVFDKKTDSPKNDRDIDSLKKDLREAEELRNMLFQKKMNLRWPRR